MRVPAAVPDFRPPPEVTWMTPAAWGFLVAALAFCGLVIWYELSDPYRGMEELHPGLWVRSRDDLAGMAYAAYAPHHAQDGPLPGERSTVELLRGSAKVRRDRPLSGSDRKPS